MSDPSAITQLLSELDGEPRAVARRLVREVLALHRDGIAAMARAGRRTPEVAAAWRADPQVMALLALHEVSLEAGATCELCGQGVSAEHEHLFEPAARQVRCVCGPCAILFPAREAARFIRPEGRPARRVELPPGLLEGLGVPVDLAGIYRSGDRAVALYPSPAGLVEADLNEQLPPLVGALPPGEALLVRAQRDAAAAWQVPIDACFVLAGLVRRHWEGLTGGPVVQRQLDRFFEALDHG